MKTGLRNFLGGGGGAPIFPKKKKILFFFLFKRAELDLKNRAKKSELGTPIPRQFPNRCSLALLPETLVWGFGPHLSPKNKISPIYPLCSLGVNQVKTGKNKQARPSTIKKLEGAML